MGIPNEDDTLFKTEYQKDYVKISFPRVPVSSSFLNWKTTSEKWIKDSPIFLVLDWSSASGLPAFAIQHLSRLSKELQTKKILFFSMGMSKEILEQIEKSGLGRLFPVIKNIEEGFQKADIRPPPGPFSYKKILSAEFLNPLIMATLATFENLCGIKLLAGKPSLKTPQESYPYDLGGINEISNDYFQGTITLCFKNSSILKIYEMITGTENATLSSDVGDAASEILNIIMGQVKTELNKKNFNITRTIPKVIKYNAEMASTQGPGQIILILPFQTDLGPIHIEISASARNS